MKAFNVLKWLKLIKIKNLLFIYKFQNILKNNYSEFF